ncbi:diguanylate cyclase [Ideonella sp. DXS22W]|uniref:Diguanylate cyclase n=1 Tax=Pseudaquabacterium inlustre TaxID=2984192 RepID=A0ABU9CNX7_9BURK
MIAAPLEADRSLAVADVAIAASVLGLQAQALQTLAQQQGWPMAVKCADDGRYLVANGAFAALLGRATDEVVGRSDAELFEPAAVPALRAAEQSAQAQGGVFTSDHRFEHRGERREFSVLRVPGTGAGRALLLSVWQDQQPLRQREQQLAQALAQLEQLQKAHEQLRRESGEQGLRDQASGLNTRAHFDDQMRRELDLSVREHREFALVYMVLDPASPRVAALGERAHACICEAMGRLLRGNTRAMDASCRLDDRHFAVLLSGVGLATAHSRMEGLRRQCATQIVMLDGERLEFTVSMGVASFPHTAHGQDELVAACQAALSEARRRGGNTVALASIRFESS